MQIVVKWYKDEDFSLNSGFFVYLMDYKSFAGKLYCLLEMVRKNVTVFLFYLLVHRNSNNPTL